MEIQAIQDISQEKQEAFAGYNKVKPGIKTQDDGTNQTNSCGYERDAGKSRSIKESDMAMHTKKKKKSKKRGGRK
jgi:hypothetical protein